MPCVVCAFDSKVLIYVSNSDAHSVSQIVGKSYVKIRLAGALFFCNLILFRLLI